MSLEQPSRLAHWPRIAIRVALILLVFVGLNWWVTKQQKQQATSPTVVEQVYTLPAAALRDGIAVVFLWDVRIPASRAIITPGSYLWLDAVATSLHHQLQRLTQYAGQRSEIPLRTGVITVGSGLLHTGEGTNNPLIDARGISEVVKLDAPASGEQIRKALAAIPPGLQPYYNQAREQALQMLQASGLSERHLIIISTDPPSTDPLALVSTDAQFMKDNRVTHVHYITRKDTASEMDEQFKAVLDEILTPVR